MGWPPTLAPVIRVAGRVGEEHAPVAVGDQDALGDAVEDQLQEVALGALGRERVAPRRRVAVT